MFFSIIVGSFLIGAEIQTIPDAEGWVSVERPQPHPEEFQEEEKGVWVVFSKEIEGGKFLVRLPEDPEYRYLPGGGIQLDTTLEGEVLQLRVEKRAGEEMETYFEARLQEVGSLPETFLIKAKKNLEKKAFDLCYRTGEKWVWERVVFREKFLYTFHTESPEMMGESHRKFIASLDIF